MACGEERRVRRLIEAAADPGHPRARVIMKPGDVAAMPADIRHQGFSPKRAMLLVWENATPGLADKYDAGELSPYPIEP
jgi:ribosomal protein L16 Arg81 hydroxylase